MDGDDIGGVTRSVVIVYGSRSDVIRHVFRRARKRKGHALLAAGREGLQTAVYDVLWSNLQRQVGIEIAVHEVVEYIRIFDLILRCCTIKASIEI